MSEQDDDDPLQIPREIAREVEEAFADVPYPGDDRFYLPACMIGALLHHKETDRLFENVFYSLTSPVSKGDRMEWLERALAP